MKAEEYRAEDIGPEPPIPAPAPIRLLQDLSELEAWQLWKYRKGLNNRSAALLLGLKPDLLRSWEKAVEVNAVPMAQVRGELAEMGQLTNGERCRMYRLRVGLPINDVAGRMGVSRIWIWHMETDRVSCKRLLDMYENWVA